MEPISKETQQVNSTYNHEEVSKENEPRFSKVEVSLRMKPLGQGAGDNMVDHQNKWTNKTIQHIDYDQNTIVFGEDGKKLKTKHSFMKHLVAPESTQNDVYEQVFNQRMNDFLNGYNVMLLAYGQTGSGKTYTLLGPVGFSKPTEDVSEVHGLFPRAALTLMKTLKEQEKQGRKSIMTMRINETPWHEFTDLITKKHVKFDKKLGVVVGQSEVIVDGPETLFKLLKIIEHERQANCTKMNDRSSKTHCMMEIKVYTKFDKQVRVNYLRFLDMAGSERTYEVSTDPKEQYKGLLLNFGLVVF